MAAGQTASSLTNDADAISYEEDGGIGPGARTNRRQLTGPGRWALEAAYAGMIVLGVCFATNFEQHFGYAFHREQYLAVFLGLTLFASFLARAACRRTEPQTRVPFYDVAFALAGLVCGLYPALTWDAVLDASYLMPPQIVTLGALTVALLLEATRRYSGWPLVIITGIFILYAFFPDRTFDAIYANPVGGARLATYLYIDTNAILGQPISIVIGIVLAFVLFGTVLFATGGGRFYTDLAMGLMGRFSGGPAKMAMVASALFGTVSGSAVSNVVTTGMVTIPLMKRSGFSATQAGAIEAVASTGGQIVPPVMGATAFLLAEFLGIPYSDVVVAALVPAAFYYVCLFLQVHFIAKRDDIRGADPREIPHVRAVLRRDGAYLLPLLAVTLALFFLNWQAEKAAYLGILVTVLIYMVKRRGLGGGYARMVSDAGAALIEISLICAVSGVVIGILNITGLGSAIALLLTEVGDGNVMTLLLLVAAMSIVLGMGMPTTSVYLLLAVLIAPTVQGLGIQPLAAHLFILYFGIMSHLTPPICFAAVAAASISGASAMRTGLLAVRLAVAAFLMPFLFVFNPGLLLNGPIEGIVSSIALTLLGMVLLTAAFSGFSTRPLGPLARALCIAAAAALFLHCTPEGTGELVIVAAAAAVGFGAAFWPGGWRPAGAFAARRAR